MKTFVWKLAAIALGLVFSCALPVPVAYAGWQPSLRIGIVQGAREATVQAKGTAAVIKREGEKKALKRIPAGSAVTITAKGKEFLLDGKSVGNRKLLVQSENPKAAESLRLQVGAHAYRGTLSLLLKGGALTAVNEVAAESYLAGVVPEEMLPEWPIEAVKSQAIAARTFALKNRRRHESEGFDLCATTHCQVYGGIASEKAAATRAIGETAGEAMFYGSTLVDALFHTDSGGMTENSENVWGSYVPYLKAASEVQTGTQPWTKEIGAKELAALLAKQGKKTGEIRKIELSSLHIGKSASDRSPSGRVKNVRFVGRRGTAVLSGNALRSSLGLRSTLFQMKLKGGKVHIEGYGWGHGLGLSQWGARGWAAKGMKSADILRHYYKGITIKKLY